jgi:hypothetical protein
MLNAAWKKARSELVVDLLESDSSGSIVGPRSIQARGTYTIAAV